MKRLAAFLALTCLCGGCVRYVDVSQAAATITEDDFYRRVGVISHDSMMGRDTPSPGLDMTARWIAGEFRELGLRPGGENGTFLQHYTVQQVVPDFENSTVTTSTGIDLEFGRDLGFLFGAPGTEAVTAPVSVLTGSEAGEPGWSEGDVRGKHLIILPPEDPTGASRQAQFRLLSSLLVAGPASLVVVSQQSDEEWSRAMALQSERGQTRTPWGEDAMPLILALRQESLQRLLAGSGFNIPPEAVVPQAPVALHPVPALDLTLSPQARVLQELRAPNVVGILEGSDPRLKDEYLVYSGHMDHLGVGAPDASGDSIYNGADDDASGTVLVVEAAEAFATLRPAPRRSVIFLAVSGEEKGLWGSNYFVEFPPVPLGQIVADLNADMVGRNWPDSIVAIGKEHSDLGATLARVNEAHPELNMVAIDDRWPEENFYQRSDHIHFARRGIPILFFFNGPHEDYHRPSDEVGKIDAEKAARITRLLFYLGFELANAPARPQWSPESFRRIVGDGGGG